MIARSRLAVVGCLIVALLLAAAPRLAFAQREVWTNNAKSTLASGISSGDTSLTVATGEGARFPVITGSDYFFVTLEDNPLTIREIVKVTARAGDVFTIVRAQQSTSSSAFSAGAVVDHRLTAGTLQGLQGLSSASVDMTGETEKRVTITDSAVSTASKILLTIVRPTTTDSDDEDWKYQANIVTLAAGSFDVVISTEDPDDDLRPPTETITVLYLVR